MEDLLKKEPWRLQLPASYQEKNMEELLKSKRESVLIVLAKNNIEVEALYEKNHPTINKVLLENGHFLDRFRHHEDKNLRYLVAYKGKWSMEFLMDKNKEVVEEANRFIIDKHLVPSSIIKKIQFPIPDYFFCKEYALSLVEDIDSYPIHVQKKLAVSHPEIIEFLEFSPAYYEEILDYFIEDKERMWVMFERFLDYLKELYPAFTNIEEAMRDDNVLRKFYKYGYYTRLTPFPFYLIETKEEWKQVLTEPTNKQLLRDIKNFPIQLRSFLVANQTFELLSEESTMSIFMEAILSLPEDLFEPYRNAVNNYLSKIEKDAMRRNFKEQLIEKGLLLEYYLKEARFDDVVLQKLIDIGYRLDVLATYSNQNQEQLRITHQWKYGYNEPPYYHPSNATQEEWRRKEWIITASCVPIIRNRNETMGVPKEKQDLLDKCSILVPGLSVKEVASWTMNDYEPLHFPKHQKSKDPTALEQRKTFLQRRNKKALFLLSAFI